MQLQNSGPFRKKVIYISVFGFCVAAVILGLLLWPDSQTDKPSGEEVSNPKNIQPESYGTNKNAIVFYGTSKLIQAGVSNFMVDTFREQLQLFSTKHDNYIKKISVYATSITTQNGDDEDTVGFNILVNDKDKSSVKLIYSGLLAVRVVIYDSNGQSLLNSGVIRYEAGDSADYTGDGVPPEDQN